MAKHILYNVVFPQGAKVDLTMFPATLLSQNTCPVQSPQAQKETLRISSTGSSSPEKTIFVGQSWTCKVDPGTGEYCYVLLTCCLNDCYFGFHYDELITN